MPFTCGFRSPATSTRSPRRAPASPLCLPGSFSTPSTPRWQVWLVCNVDVQPLEGTCFTLADLSGGANSSLVDPATEGPTTVEVVNSLNTRATGASLRDRAPPRVQG